MRRSGSTIAPLAAALVVASVVLTACGSTTTEGVETGEVTTGSVSEVVEAPGQVSARAVTTVTSPASGTIGRLRVADGARVREGQVVLVVDSPSAQRALRDAKRARSSAGASGVDLPRTSIDSTVQAADDAAEQAFTAAEQAIAALPAGAARTQAQVALAQARAQYASARAQALAAASSVDQGAAALEGALGSLGATQQQQADAAVAAAQRTVDALTVRAPIAGVVTFGAQASSSGSAGSLLDQLPSSLQGAASSLLGGASGGGGGGTASSTASGLTAGLPVSSGQTLFTVTDTSGLSLTTQVDETDILLVKPGIKASAQLDAVPDADYSAVVTSVGVTPTTSSRGGVSYVVRLRLGNGRTADDARAPAPLPGMSAVAQLRVREERDVVAVPASAVFRDGGKDAVWLVENGTATKREVTLGAQGEDRIAIASGLVVGDTIVVRGADRVREGQVVE